MRTIVTAAIAQSRHTILHASAVSVAIFSQDIGDVNMAKVQRNLLDWVTMAPMATWDIGGEAASDIGVDISDTDSAADFDDVPARQPSESDELPATDPVTSTSGPDASEPLPPSPMLDDREVLRLSAMNGASSSGDVWPPQTDVVIHDTFAMERKFRNIKRAKLRGVKRSKTPASIATVADDDDVDDADDNDDNAPLVAPTSSAGETEMAATNALAAPILSAGETGMTEVGPGRRCKRSRRRSTVAPPTDTVLPHAGGTRRRRRLKVPLPTVSPEDGGGDEVNAEIPSIDDPPPAACPLRTRGRHGRKRRKQTPVLQTQDVAAPTPVVEPLSVECVPCFMPSPLKVTPECSKCRLPLDPAKREQLSGKGLGAFKCSLCNTRSVQISRRGIYKDFMASHKGIDKAEAADFWQALGKTKTPAEMDKLMHESITRRTTHRRQAAAMGVCCLFVVGRSLVSIRN